MNHVYTLIAGATLFAGIGLAWAGLMLIMEWAIDRHYDRKTKEVS